MKVLIAEDHPVLREMLRGHLQEWGHEVVAVENGRQAWSVLARPEAPRIAILDWVMPGIDGPTVCRRLREKRREPYTYVILVTKKDDMQSMIEGFDAGADDYIVKPFRAPELRARVRAGQRLVELHEELITAREQLRTQSRTDAMLSIWNRHAIFEILHGEIHRATRLHRSMCVLLADVDHFKKVNDTHGHLVGDALLRQIVARTKGCLRAYDSLGRYGGEEFLIVLPDCALADSVAIAERIRYAVRSAKAPAGEETVTTTISIGAAGKRQNEVIGSDELVRVADEALYRAKSSGRDCVRQMAPATCQAGR